MIQNDWMPSSQSSLDEWAGTSPVTLAGKRKRSRISEDELEGPAAAAGKREIRRPPRERDEIILEDDEPPAIMLPSEMAERKRKLEEDIKYKFDPNTDCQICLLSTKQVVIQNIECIIIEKMKNLPEDNLCALIAHCFNTGVYQNDQDNRASAKTIKRVTAADVRHHFESIRSLPAGEMFLLNRRIRKLEERMDQLEESCMWVKKEDNIAANVRGQGLFDRAAATELNYLKRRDVVQARLQNDPSFTYRSHSRRKAFQSSSIVYM